MPDIFIATSARSNSPEAEAWHPGLFLARSPPPPAAKYTSVRRRLIFTIAGRRHTSACLPPLNIQAPAASSSTLPLSHSLPPPYPPLPLALSLSLSLSPSLPPSIIHKIVYEWK